MVGHWDRLPKAVVTALSLLELKRCLDNTPDIGSDFGVIYVESGVGLDDPCVSHPAQDIL